MLHLLHHLLHPDSLTLILSMYLLLDVLLHIHVVESPNYLAHVFKVINCFPKLFELMIFDKLLAFIEVEDERFQLKLVDPFIIIIEFVLKVSGDLSSEINRILG